MSKIMIVYYSQGGSTGLLAEAIAAGARSVEGTEVELLRILGEKIVEGRWKDDAALERVSLADAILFGAPTFMGGPAAQFKAFADATSSLWFARRWTGKIGGGFTIGGSPSGDKSNTLQYFATLSAQHGMLWANWDELPRQKDGTNRLGSSIGLMTQNTSGPGSTPVLDPGDALSGEKYGRFVAGLAKRLG